MSISSVGLPDAKTLLFVDDEPQSCKWFARTFGDEFTIVTAGGVDDAISVLQKESASIALLVTDYRMPQRNGLELLKAARHQFRHVVRLLATAYAEKSVAIAAVNEGHVFRILEKPLDEASTRQAIRDGLEMYRLQALDRALQENRTQAMRETLGFLAHELNTPLTTVRGYMTALRDRHIAMPEGAAVEGQFRAEFTERRAGEVMSAVDAADRNALYCQSLVSTFVKSAREAYPDNATRVVSAANLLGTLLDGFPFSDNEREQISTKMAPKDDFNLPPQRDLLYLVLGTLMKNALLATDGRSDGRLVIELGRDSTSPRRSYPWIKFIDNGHGIPKDMLSRLTRESLTTRANAGGSGMGLVFCSRVLQSVGGSIDIESELGAGTTVTLRFPSITEITDDFSGKDTQ